MKSLQIAKQTQLDLDEDCAVFSFKHSKTGEEWEGAIEEWVGNQNFHEEEVDHPYIENETLLLIGSSGGGADYVMINQKEEVLYMMDIDHSISKVADSIEEFIKLIKQ